MYKIHHIEGFSQRALDNVSISFRESEFVSILGEFGGETSYLFLYGGDIYATRQLQNYSPSA